MQEQGKGKEKTWQELEKEKDAQAICSHDAPGQQPGVACIRCGKILPAAEKKDKAPAPTPVPTI